MGIETFKIIFILTSILFLFLIRKNTILNLLLLTFSIPFETYINFKIGFTLKPAQIFAISTLISMILNKEKIFTSIKEHIPYLLILFAQLLSLFNAPMQLIFKNYQGSIRMIFNFLFLYFIAYIISYAVKNLVILRKVVLTLILGGATSVLLELARSGFTDWGLKIEVLSWLCRCDTDCHTKAGFFWWLPTGFLRLTPLNMSPNQFAAYLNIVVIFLTVYTFKISIIQNRFFRNIYPLLFAIVFYSFILTFSRGPWVSYIIALLIIIWHTKENIFNSIVRYILCISISFILLFTVYPKTLEPVLERSAILPIYNTFVNKFKHSTKDRYDYSTKDRYDYSTKDRVDRSTVDRVDRSTVDRVDRSTVDRVDRYKISFNNFLSNPIIGNGWGSDLLVHNTVLQLLSESGIIGLSAFVFFAFFVARRVYIAIQLSKWEMKAFAVGTGAALFGTGVSLLTDIGLYQIQTWFIIGLGLAMGHIKETKL